MYPQKIISFSGCHGIGKTSIIRKLADKCIINSVAVDLDQFNFYPKDLTQNQIKRILNGYETIRNIQAPFILTDRSQFDALIYTETFEEFGMISSEESQIIHDTFRALPESYKLMGYIIFLNPSVDRILENINKRKRESSQIMLNKEFVTALHKRFNRFYDQMHKVMRILVIDNNNGDYTPEKIVNAMQEKLWLQPYEINSDLHVINDKFGLYSKELLE